MNRTADPATILSVSGLSKSYGDLIAVNDLSFEVRRGEVFGFLGPNGAGKTTAISLVCGLLKSDAGEIRIDGLSLERDYRKYRKSIGLCPQDLVIWESLTCLEQLEFMARLYDVGRKDARKKSLELLEVLGLAKKQHKLARTLSGGMKRRLNIALALVHEPPLLILDEPQAGLDPQSRILVREYIKSLSRRTTVILTTHDMDEADRLADRVAVIDHGKLLVLDTAGNLKKHIGEGDILEIKLAENQEGGINRLRHELPENLRHLSTTRGVLRLVGVDIVDALPTLLERFSHEHLAVEDITIRKKTLEDVFIALTGRGLRE
jgi:ABC-2 type transport system ATP-binding protein